MMASEREASIGKMIHRVTKEGRHLTYCLKVIQQPERARACGSGAKSSADRRPVDPPPVVELKIYEGDDTSGEDITFSYNANFFLFATLEVSRTFAQPRGQQSTAAQIPVLTGMPVSGMAYLDRPAEAGYFIFPDLSVRHEGKYKLSFNLYEETKEAKDADKEPANNQKPKVPGAPDSSFDWRLEVSSKPFTVFSAKKFPGLAESTVLSRTVAEQGCRVRIRRDVRMRRREGKQGGDYDEVEPEEYARGRSTAGDDRARSRSLSGPPVASYERRNSGEFQGYSCTPSPVHPHPSGPQSHLDFGRQAGGFAQPQFPQPQVPTAPSYTPGPSHYQQQEYRQGPPQPPPTHYGYDRQYPVSAYPTSAAREHEYEEFRRHSYAHPPPAPPGSQIQPTVDPYYHQRSVQQYGQYPPRPHSPSMRPTTLAPLKMAATEPKREILTSPLTSINRIAPTVLSPSYERGPERSASYSHYSAVSQVPAPAEQPRNGKRSFDSVFNSAASNQSLYNGMRPSSSHHNDGLYDDDEETMSLEQLKMQYKRADGSEFSRELPAME